MKVNKTKVNKSEERPTDTRYWIEITHIHTIRHTFQSNTTLIIRTVNVA